MNKPGSKKERNRGGKGVSVDKEFIRLMESDSIPNIKTIGQNIKKYRVAKKMRQEGLAELCGLSSNYIGMLERGEKLPSIEAFIRILNALEVSADLVLIDVLNVGYTVKQSVLEEKLEKVSPEEREKIYDVIDVMLKHSK